MCFLALHVFLEECLLKPLAHFFESLFFHCVLGGLHMFWWRRQWHPTPVCLPGKSHGLRSLPTVHGVAKSRTQLSDFTSTFHFHALEKEMATHSSILAWRIPGTGEPGGLPSKGSHSRTRLKRLSSSSSTCSGIFPSSSVGKRICLQRRRPWRRQWHPTPVLLPGESHAHTPWQATVRGIANSRTLAFSHVLVVIPPHVMVCRSLLLYGWSF